MPLKFFGLGALLCVLVGLWFGVPVIIDYFNTGLVVRFPRTFLAASLMIIGMVSLACGLILETVTKGRTETKRLTYLHYRAPGER